MAAGRSSVDLTESTVARWYDGKSVFITGATGFMGKVLVEKLLSSCPGINRIYLLLRHKKEACPAVRLEQLKQTVIFDRLRKSHPSRLDKLVAISGDITFENLGIAEDDRQIMSDISVVFHSAATVKFDEQLRLSVNMNMKGTMRIIQLCKSLPKLEVLVHVSTAYCNCDQKAVSERVYPSPGDPKKTIAAVEALDDDIISDITDRLIGNRPNTYTFTKAMAESILAAEKTSFPIAIVRPSIVTAAWRWPLPGWVDNLNGPTGVLAGAGKGILRTLYCKRKMQADLIPVDIAINTLIVTAWNTSVERQQGVKVYNCTSGLENPLKWGELEDWGKKFIVKHPFDDVIWYPGGSFKDTKTMDNIYFTLFHIIPAYIIDYSAKLFGKQTKSSMVRIQHKLKKALDALEFFMTNEWTFYNYNIQTLRNKLTEADRVHFEMDIKKVEWMPYFEAYVKGTRKYIMKEEDKNITKAKRHLRMMYVIHRLSQFVLLFGFLRVLLRNSELARRLTFNLIAFTFLAINKLHDLYKNLHS